MLYKNSLLIFFCFFLLFVKVFAISQTELNLYGDEAQYWLWSQALDFGYFSKPPFLAWLIFVVSNFFGDSFFVLKMIPVSLYVLSSLMIYFLSKKLYGNVDFAILAATSFFLMPAVTFSSFLISTDILLIFFWIASMMLVLKIIEEPKTIFLFFLGLFLGFAFLSKYAAIYFLISLLLFFIFEKKKYYRVLTNPLGILIFVSTLVVVISPNIYWNYNNGWNTFFHTAENASLNNININFVGGINFLLSQIVMMGFLLVLSFFYYLSKISFVSFEDRFLLSFGLPAFTIVFVEAFLVRSHANWAAVSLVSFFVLFLFKVYCLNLKLVYFNNYLSLCVGLILFVLISLNLSLSIFDRVSGIKGFEKELQQQNTKKIDKLVIGDRMLFASMSYIYRNKKIDIYTPYIEGKKIGHHFQLTDPLPKEFNENFILIGYKDQIDYLLSKNIKKLLFNKKFVFSNENIEVYEVVF